MILTLHIIAVVGLLVTIWFLLAARRYRSGKPERWWQRIIP